MKDVPDFKKYGADDEDINLYKRIKRLIRILMLEKKVVYKRTVSTADLFTDRWEKAEFLEFGKGSSVYDSCLVLGEVSVGENTWIGPNTVLDGSGGGLEIGDDCNVSAGVQIYTHDTVNKVINGGTVEKSPVSIGKNVYIGPNTIITRGVTIGDYVVIGANSLVKTDLPDGVKAWGTPAAITGSVKKK